MRTWLAFMKKEWTYQVRTGKLFVLGLLFAAFGIMNPAVAKLTPWLMELFSESFAQSGINVSQITVTAMDSWVQFFKNIPMALIVFVILQGGIFAKEYQSGTLVLALTKGLQRYKVVISKALMLVLLWSVGYWLCFGITYAYNAYFWDNGVVQNLGFSTLCWWLFGVWIIALTVLFSTLSATNTGVLLGCGGVVLGLSLLGLIPTVNPYLPTLLMDGNSLIYGLESVAFYTSALVITVITTVACFVISVPIFNKKQL